MQFVQSASYVEVLQTELAELATLRSPDNNTRKAQKRIFELEGQVLSQEMAMSSMKATIEQLQAELRDKELEGRHLTRLQVRKIQRVRWYDRRLVYELTRVTYVQSAENMKAMRTNMYSQDPDSVGGSNHAELILELSKMELEYSNLKEASTHEQAAAVEQMEALRSELSQYRAKEQTQLSRESGLQSELETARHHIHDLETQLAAAGADRESQLAAFEAQNTALQDRLKQAEMQCDTLRADTARGQEQVSQLAARLTGMTRERVTQEEAFQQEKALLQDRLQQADAECHRLQVDVAEAQSREMTHLAALELMRSDLQSSAVLIQAPSREREESVDEGDALVRRNSTDEDDANRRQQQHILELQAHVRELETALSNATRTVVTLHAGVAAATDESLVECLGRIVSNPLTRQEVSAEVRFAPTRV